MRRGALALSLAFVAGLLTAPHPTAALTITIDDSTDTLAVTSDSTATHILTGTGNVITDFLGNQFLIPNGASAEWAAITDDVFVAAMSNILALHVLEPGTTLLSDQLAPGGVDLLFFSDIDSQPPLDVAFDCANQAVQGVACISETGSFQEVGAILYPGTDKLSIRLRSDVDAISVPEPTSLVLFGTALVGFGVMRRRRRIS